MEPSKINSITLRNTEYFEDIIKIIDSGKNVCIPAHGNSMLPLIRTQKDVLVVKKIAKTDIKKNKIVLARASSDNYIIHRVKKIENGLVYLRGDGNIKTCEVCRIEDIKAEVITIKKKNRNLDSNSLEWKLVDNFWPSNYYIRKLIIAIYTRLF